MEIEFTCRTCHTTYSVRDTLAGRTAQCKTCGQRFQIPYRTPVVKLDDDMVAKPPPAVVSGAPTTTTAALVPPAPKAGTAAGAATRRGRAGEPPRTFAEYEPLRKQTKRKPAAEPDDAFIALPSTLNDVWLPIALSLIFYGASAHLAGEYVLHRPYALLAGLLIAGMAAFALWAVVIPLTVRVAAAAADSFDFKPSNALWLHVMAAVSFPVYGMMFGMFRIGTPKAAALGGAAGACLAVIALAVMLQTSALKAFQSAVIAAIAFAVSTAAATVIIWGISSWAMPRWGLNLPWLPEPPLPEQITGAAKAPATAASRATQP